jgi:hypothetical protein
MSKQTAGATTTALFRIGDYVFLPPDFGPLATIPGKMDLGAHGKADFPDATQLTRAPAPTEEAGHGH